MHDHKSMAPMLCTFYPSRVCDGQLFAIDRLAWPLSVLEARSWTPPDPKLAPFLFPEPLPAHDGPPPSRCHFSGSLPRGYER